MFVKVTESQGNLNVQRERGEMGERERGERKGGKEGV